MSDKLNDMIRAYNAMPEITGGKEKLEAMKTALKLAYEYKDPVRQFRIARDIAEYSVFYLDEMDMYVRIPEMISLYEKNESYFGEDELVDVLFGMKWMIGDADEFTEIDAKTVDLYCEKYKEYLLKYNYSLHSYHYMKFQIEISSGRNNEEIIRKHYMLYKKLPRDRVSDCAVCEAATEIDLMLYMDNVEEAKRILEQRACRGRCAEQPFESYSAFGKYYFNRNDYEMADQYFELCLKDYRRKGGAKYGYGYLVANTSFLDTGKAMRYFQKDYFDETTRNFKELLVHYIGGAYLFLNLLKEGKQKTRLTFLKRYSGLANTNGTYQVADVAQYFMKQIARLATQLDASNSSRMYQDKLDKIVEYQKEMFCLDS